MSKDVKRVNLNLPKDMHMDAKMLAESKGVTFTELVSSLLVQYIKDNPIGLNRQERSDHFADTHGIDRIWYEGNDKGRVKPPEYQKGGAKYEVVS